MNLKSAFSIYFIKQIGFWLCKNCNKIQELENRRDLHTPALGPFNYHIKGKCKCLYQLLINLTLPISIRQMFEVLKQRQETKYTETYSEPYEAYETECFAKKVFNYLCKLFSKYIHCVKSTHIRSYSGPYFSAFGLNTERYSVSLLIQSKCRKMGTRTTPNKDTFDAVIQSRQVFTNPEFPPIGYDQLKLII